MTLSRSVKTVLYAVLSLAVCVFSMWVTRPMYIFELSVEIYLRSVILLCLAASTVLGVGVYIRLFHAKKSRHGRADSVFWMVTGGVLLLLSLAVTLRFGGMTQQGLGEAVAVNVNLMLFGLLPVPFLVRTLVLAAGVKSGKTARIVALGGATLAVVCYAVLVASGLLLQTLR